MKISIVGSGRWGSFIAWYLNRLGNDITVYGRENSSAFSLLQKERKNQFVTLPNSIKLTTNLTSSLNDAEVIVISISAQKLRDFLSLVDKEILQTKTFVLCMKGLECQTGERLTQVAVECGVCKDNLAVWVGPGHIQEFVQGNPNCMLIDSSNSSLTKTLADAFKSDLIRFYYGNDLIGSEIGSASKNVMGVVAGMLDGLGLQTLKGALMSRGAREVARLIKAMGGNELSAYGLCHLGDYETTLFSKYSNNRAYGEAFIKGEKFEKLAEGVMTAKAMKLLGEKYGVELPITNALCAVLFENKKGADELLKLFSRALRTEF